MRQQDKELQFNASRRFFFPGFPENVAQADFELKGWVKPVFSSDEEELD